MTSAPSRFKSPFLRNFLARGQYYDCTDAEALDELFLKERVTCYIGFDCTAPSLHVGHALQIMTLRRLQQAGHRPIVVIGGGTSKVGDPSFRNEARPLLSEEQIEANKREIRKTFERFLSFGDGPSDALMVDNAEWLDKLEYVPFLREIGRHFSVNRMLTMESVKAKIDNDLPFSFLEFNYSIMQAYDFVELYRRYGCRLQSAGSDQWGNIVSGIDLGRRVENVQLFGLTTPLLTTSSGAKMGKTAAGAVWLNPDMRSPYEYWQFWRNTEDGDVGRFLRLFTDLEESEIARLESLQGSELNDAKKVLATEATALCHGRAAADAAAETARRTFEEGVLGENLPTVDMDWAGGKGWTKRSADAILKESGLATSLSDARRKIAENAVRINDILVSSPETAFERHQVDQKTNAFKVQYGKKKIVLVRPV